MGNHPLCICLVVVGRNHKQCIGSHSGIFLALIDGSFRTVGAAADNYRDSSFDCLQGAFHDRIILFVRHGAGFTGCTQNQNTIRSVFHMPFQNFLQLIKIHTSILMKRSYQSDNTSFNIKHMQLLLSGSFRQDQTCGRAADHRYQYAALHALI